MTSMETLVVIVFALLGYWIVSAVLNRKPPDSSDARAKSDPGSAGTENDSTQGASEREAGTWSDREHRSDSQDVENQAWYQVLGVAEHATTEQITAAYKKMMNQYHPDKVAHMGDELRSLAERKSMQINAAYDDAMKRRR